MVKKIIPAALGALLLSTQVLAAEPLNILVITADDVGWSNVSSYGGDIMGVSTPNIDRIGKEGLRLTSFYAEPTSTAGRSAFITGQMPVRTGLTLVGTPGSPIGLQKEDPTIAEVLKAQGYLTAQYGKNHLGDRDEHLPCNHGFEEYFGNLYHLNASEDLEDPDRPTDPAFRKRYDPRSIVSCTAGGAIKDEGALTTKRMETYDEEIVNHSLSYLDKRAKDKKPFFLWVNPSRMHVFLHVKPEDRNKSRAGEQDIFGDALREHDMQVGEILNRLDKTGLAKNTIVVWTTDNGPYKYMWPQGGTSPFRGDKGTSWEGGVRVPTLVRWPGAPGGRVSSEIVSVMDFFPTFAHTAGVDDVADKLKNGASFGGRSYKVHLDGFDQTALFSGKSDKSTRDTYFYYDESKLTAVRYKQHKIIFSGKASGDWDAPLDNYSRPWIVNLRMDPYEEHLNSVTRQLDEHKTWLLTPLFLSVVQEHLMSFKQFPPRQIPYSLNFGEMISNVQRQLQAVRKATN